MRMIRVLLVTVILTIAYGPVAAPQGPAGWDEACERENRSRSATFDFPESSDARLRVSLHVFCYVEGGDTTASIATDCPATDYVALGYRWASPFSAVVDASKSGLDAAGVQAAFAGSAETWDQGTSADIFGSVNSGVAGKGGRLDGVNMFAWKKLSRFTIAQTTTWYSSATGDAVESDASYNTLYRWSLAGEASRMDMANIATHEIGHTFGLGHPANTATNSCLTMFPTADYGETQKRTLGDGDLLGLQAKYGA